MEIFLSAAAVKDSINVFHSTGFPEKGLISNLGNFT